jgi:hypothetical protein
MLEKVKQLCLALGTGRTRQDAGGTGNCQGDQHCEKLQHASCLLFCFPSSTLL